MNKSKENHYKPTLAKTIGDFISTKEKIYKIIFGEENNNEGKGKNDIYISSLVELYNIIKSNRKKLIRKLKVSPEILDSKLIRETIKIIKKKTEKIVFSELENDPIVTIIGHDEEIKQRVLVKLTIMLGEIDEDYLIEIIKLVDNNKFFTEFIDFIGSERLIILFKNCKAENLAKYIISNNDYNKLRDKTDKISTSSIDNVKKIAKKINKEKSPFYELGKKFLNVLLEKK